MNTTTLQWNYPLLLLWPMVSRRWRHHRVPKPISVPLDQVDVAVDAVDQPTASATAAAAVAIIVVVALELVVVARDGAVVQVVAVAVFVDAARAAAVAAAASVGDDDVVAVVSVVIVVCCCRRRGVGSRGGVTMGAFAVRAVAEVISCAPQAQESSLGCRRG